MEPNNVAMIINTERSTAEDIRQHVELTGARAQLTERKNLSGDTAAWILIATLAANALPHVLAFVKDLLKTKQVQKIKIGDWEVDNPTPEIIEEFLRRTKKLD